jgi:predicted alpha/beta-hydrolase family hydrolase
MSAVEGVLLAHGAGSDRNAPGLVAIEEALAPLPVERFDFPYRLRGGRRPPDRAPVLVAAVVEAATALADRIGAPPGRLVLGGRSMGGRMCSMAVAEGHPAAGLVLVAYPLHPPGRPDRLRTDHLPALDLPCLFVSGTRDPFGTPEELAAATATVPGPVTTHLVEGGRHDLKGAERRVAGVVAAWLAALAGPGEHA